MAGKPRVFVSRIIPEAGLSRIRAGCDAEVWPEPLPPSYDVLRQKVAGCDGPVSLLTDRVDWALMDAAPRLTQIAVTYARSALTAPGVYVGTVTALNVAGGTAK